MVNTGIIIGIPLGILVAGGVWAYRIPRQIKAQKARAAELKPLFDFLIKDYSQKIRLKIQAKEIISVESVSWDLDTVVKESYPEIPSFNKLHKRPYTLSVSDLIKRVHWAIDPQELILSIKES